MADQEQQGQEVKKKKKYKDNRSIWALIDNPKPKIVLPEEKKGKQKEEDRYYAVVPTFNSSRQVQKAISNANHHMTQRRREELKKDGKLKGWQKQEGIVGILKYQTMMEIEKETKRKLRIIYDALDNKTYSEWHHMFGPKSTLENSLKWCQMMLDEFRYQRDNPRLANMGKPKREKKNDRKNKKRTKRSGARKATDQGDKP